jgi:hypothetical protein
MVLRRKMSFVWKRAAVWGVVDGCEISIAHQAGAKETNAMICEIEHMSDRRKHSRREKYEPEREGWEHCLAECRSIHFAPTYVTSCTFPPQSIGQFPQLVKAVQLVENSDVYYVR